jgi:hypothetical protein
LALSHHAGERNKGGIDVDRYEEKGRGAVYEKIWIILQAKNKNRRYIVSPNCQSQASHREVRRAVVVSEGGSEAKLATKALARAAT